MNQDSVKETLLNLENTDLEFSVIFTGKKSTKVNGLYRPHTREILLHNKNFNTDNQLIYTAIHEYTHHLLNNEVSRRPHQRVHNNEFWALFHTLLDVAEKKGIYKREIDEELKKLIDEARKLDEEIARLQKEQGKGEN